MVVPKLGDGLREARGADRASIYLAATLYCDGFSSPVKLRNISATGALVEGTVAPAVGALVQLVRGALIVHGLVAWSVEGRCGLRFSGCIDVQQWRAVPTNGEQERVDEIVRLVKAGAVPLPVAPLSHSSLPEEIEVTGSDLCSDLTRASDLLEKMGGILAADPETVARHGAALQSLDIALQVIAAVEAAIGGRTAPETDAARLVGLRRSAEQALKNAH